MPPSLRNFDSLAEERIQEAIRRGEFDNLPGVGKPLEFDDDLLVPAEIRAAHRILKNAGLVPVEVLERREVAELETRLRATRGKRERARMVARLALLRLRLGPRRAGRLARDAYYESRILAKLGGG